MYEGSTALCTNLYLILNGTQYNLVQIHFHSPSEHTIGGGYYDAEVHLVHKSAVSNKLLVVGVLLEAASTQFTTPSNNTFLNTLWIAGGTSTLAGTSVVVEESSNLVLSPYETFLPGRSSHYTYNGSLTVPPCYELVTWLLYDEPVRMSQSDYFMLRSASATLKTNVLSASGNSNRYPSMPRNNRDVFYVGGMQQQSAQSSSCVSQCGDDDDDNIDVAYASRRLGVAALVIGVVALIVSLGFAYLLLQTRKELGIALSKLNAVPQNVELATVNKLAADSNVQTNA